MLPNRIVFLPLLAFSLSSCNSGKKNLAGGTAENSEKTANSDASSTSQTTISDQKFGPKNNNGGVGTPPAVAAPAPDKRSRDEQLCQEGPKFTAASPDFKGIWDSICAGSTTNDFFKQLVADPYIGGEDKKFKLITFTVGELYVTRLTYAYAMKIPLAVPANVVDYKLYDRIKKGVTAPGSKLDVKVDSVDSTLAKGRVEQVVYSYDLSQSKGAGIFDKRTTEQNSYIVVDGVKDLAMSAETLRDPDKNESYVQSNSLVIAMKADGQSSYFIYVADLVIKNRIDPIRARDTLLDLAKGAHKLLWDTMSAAPR